MEDASAVDTTAELFKKGVDARAEPPDPHNFKLP